MIKKALVSTLVVALSLPLFAFAQPLPPQPAQVICPTLTRSLYRGIRGPDVVLLQDFLIAIGSLATGNDTGYFGVLTTAAAVTFQVSHGVPGTGFVGPLTRAAIVAVCNAGQTTQVQTQTQIQTQTTQTQKTNSDSVDTNAGVDGYFSASPRPYTDANGQPVAHFVLYAYYNANGDQTYTIQFGDGASATVNSSDYTLATDCFPPTQTPPGCIGRYSVGHTYASAGTYTATIKNASNQIVDTLTAVVP